VKTTGDGFVVEFSSVLDELVCASECKLGAPNSMRGQRNAFNLRCYAGEPFLDATFTRELRKLHGETYTPLATGVCCRS
jgi:hypothetical protein